MAADFLANITNVIAATEGGEASGVAGLGINLSSLVFQLITFAIVFFVLKKFAFGPILKTLETRRKTIEEGLKNAGDMEKKTEELNKKIEQKLRDTRKQADAIIAQAHEEAGAISKAAQDRAAEKTEQMIADAHSKIDSDVVRAKKELEGEMLDLLADATEAVLKEKIDRTKDTQLLARSLNEAKEEI